MSSKLSSKRINWKRKVSTTGWYLLLTVFALFTAVPFLWAGLMSVREVSSNVFAPGEPAEILPVPGMIGWGEGLRVAEEEGSYGGIAEETGGWWRDFAPEGKTWLEGSLLAPYAFPATTGNYYEVMDSLSVERFFLNSLIMSLGTVALSLILCSLCAYPLAKMRFAGRNVLFVLVLATLILPPQLLIIPLYIMAVNVFDFQNTYYGLILPFAVNGLGIFLLRQIYYSIPDELIEAATIDGASPFGIWWRILLPLIKPGLATLAIIVFVTQWNTFLWPLLMLTDNSLYTLPVGLSYLQGVFSGSMSVIAAGIVIATVPVIIVFMIFQRQVIRGLAGAVKG